MIRAFNNDMPYDEFVRKQIAADRMNLKDKRDLAALGFITCARCHDHKCGLRVAA